MLPVVVVGLGNPGKRYAKTRHNIGFRVVERLAEKLNWSFHKEERFLGHYAKGRIGDRICHLLLPVTYMNESGQAARAISHYFKVLGAEVLVIHDDVALPFGQLRIRLRGSPGGHNGLKSIEACLGTPHYPRLKLGIGDERDGDLADHVLAPFTEEEQKRLPEFIECAADVAYALLNQDIHKVMAVVNKKEK